MTDRFTVSTPRERENAKTWWTRIGTAWRTKDGRGFNVVLDALPVNGKLLIMPDEPHGERRDAPAAPAGAQQRIGDEDIPF